MFDTKQIRLLDKFAISSSTICAIHCVALPFIIGVFPAIGASIFADEAFHIMMLWLVIPLSLFGLTLGCRKHKNVKILSTGFVGIAVLALTAFFGHDLAGENGERLATLFGASLIAIAHIRNYMSCQSGNCSHD